MEERRCEAARSYGYFRNSRGSSTGWKFQFECGSERSGFFASNCLAIIDDGAAGSQLGLQGNDKIVHDCFAGNGLEQLTPDGVDAAVGAQQGSKLTLAFFEEGLIFPVQAIGILTRVRVR